MALRVLSLTVFSNTTKRILLPWQILGLEIPSTFAGFYKSTVKQKLEKLLPWTIIGDDLTFEMLHAYPKAAVSNHRHHWNIYF